MGIVDRRRPRRAGRRAGGPRGAGRRHGDPDGWGGEGARRGTSRPHLLGPAPRRPPGPRREGRPPNPLLADDEPRHRRRHPPGPGRPSRRLLHRHLPADGVAAARARRRPVRRRTRQPERARPRARGLPDALRRSACSTASSTKAAATSPPPTSTTSAPPWTRRCWACTAAGRGGDSRSSTSRGPTRAIPARLDGRRMIPGFRIPRASTRRRCGCSTPTPSISTPRRSPASTSTGLTSWSRRKSQPQGDPAGEAGQRGGDGPRHALRLSPGRGRVEIPPGQRQRGSGREAPRPRAGRPATRDDLMRPLEGPGRGASRRSRLWDPRPFPCRSRGRILAEDVIAPGDVPPFPNSAMDGFASPPTCDPSRFASG